MNEKQGVAYQLTKKRGGKIYKAFVARVVEWILIVLFGGIIGYILGRMNPSPIWPGFLMAILLFITGIMGIVVIISSTIAKLKSNKEKKKITGDYARARGKIADPERSETALEVRSAGFTLRSV